MESYKQLLARIALAAGMLLAGPTLADAATCTFSTDGVMSGGGSCARTTTTSDDCIINAGVEMVADEAAGVCATLTVNGAMVFKEGVRTYTVGDGAGAKDDQTDIGAAGELRWGAGQSFLVDTANATPATGNGRITSAGAIIGVGAKLASGTIDAFTEVTGDAPNGLVMLTDRSLRQTSLDQYNGKLLVPTSGYYRWQAFDITTGGATKNEINIDVDNRGARDSRNVAGRVDPTTWSPGDWGEIYSTGNVTVDADNVTLTFSSAFSTLTRANDVLLGSRFICAADAGAANDGDIRRICTVTSTTVATLCTAYGTASCDIAATYRVYDDNQPANGVTLVESFRSGDTYEIWDPAILSVAVANRNDDTQTDHIELLINDGSTTHLQYIDIGYCGASISASNNDCIDVNRINNDSASEGFYLSDFDMHNWGGLSGLVFTDSSNITVKRGGIRDANEGGDGLTGSNEAHVIRVSDPVGNGRTTNLTFEDLRLVRANDDILTVGSATEADSRFCDGCAFKRIFAGFTPANGGGSVEGFQPSIVWTNLAIDDTFITNINGSVFDWASVTTTQAISGYIRNSIFQNSQSGLIINFTLTNQGGPTDANFSFSVINSVLRAPARGENTVTRGSYFNNYVSQLTGFGGAAMNGIQRNVRGNIILCSTNPTTVDTCGIKATDADDEYYPATARYNDNVIFAPTTFTAGTNTTRLLSVGSSAINSQAEIDHNSLWGTQHLQTGVLSGIQTNALDSSSVHSADCNILANVNTGVNKSAGSGTANANENLYWRVTTQCTSCTTNTLPRTGTILGFQDPTQSNAKLVAGSSAQRTPCSDDYSMGARVAGPNVKPLLEVYPFLGEIPFMNNVSATDKDRDGIYDLFDNCPNRANPNQADTDADDRGDACE